MDKLRLYTPHRGAIQRHIKKEFFTCTGNKVLPNDLKIYFYEDKEAGVVLTYSPSFVTIECNPTKFLNGHNYQQIDRKGLELFTTMITDRYDADFRLWDVSLFDFNSDIEVNDPPAKYFKDLGRLKLWERTPKRNGNLTYRTSSGSRAFVLYDLHKRCKKDGTPIPPEHKGKYIIRLEASFNRDLPKIKGLNDMRTLNDYLESDKYKRLPNLWVETYELIEKNEPLSEVPNLSKKECDMLASIQLHTLNGYREKLRIEYPNNYPYHFKQIEELVQKVRCHLQSQVVNRIAELNFKVREKANQLILAA